MFTNYLNKDFFLKIKRGLQVVTNWIKSNRLIRLVINIILVLIMVITLVYYMNRDWEEISKTSLKLAFLPTLQAIGLFTINYYLQLFAWHIMVHRVKVDISFRENAWLYSTTNLYKYLPTPAWFLGSRLHHYSKSGLSKRVILSITLLETALHMISGGVLLVILLLNIEEPLTWIWLLTLIPLLLAFFEMPKVFDYVSNLLNIHISLSRRDVGLILFVDFITWIIAGPFFFFLISSMGLTLQTSIVDMTRVWILSSLVAYVGAYTLGGIGVLREFSLSLQISKYINPSLAVLISIFVRLFMTVSGIVVSAATILLFKNTQRKLSEPAIIVNKVKEE